MSHSAGFAFMCDNFSGRCVRKQFVIARNLDEAISLMNGAPHEWSVERLKKRVLATFCPDCAKHRKTPSGTSNASVGSSDVLSLESAPGTGADSPARCEHGRTEKHEQGYRAYGYTCPGPENKS